MESMAHFASRVLATTGVELREIRVSSNEDDVLGYVFARRGDLYVVNINVPSHERDGTEIFPLEGFRVVNLK